MFSPMRPQSYDPLCEGSVYKTNYSILGRAQTHATAQAYGLTIFLRQGRSQRQRKTLPCRLREPTRSNLSSRGSIADAVWSRRSVGAKSDGMPPAAASTDISKFSPSRCRPGSGEHASISATGLGCVERLISRRNDSLGGLEAARCESNSEAGGQGPALVADNERRPGDG
jgi:hypothetical protein